MCRFVHRETEKSPSGSINKLREKKLGKNPCFEGEKIGLNSDDYCYV